MKIGRAMDTKNMSTTKDKYKVGDLVKYRASGSDLFLALVIEKTPHMKRYRIKWCRSGEAIWVWEDILTPAY